jgi:threonine dehydratase
MGIIAEYAGAMGMAALESMKDKIRGKNIIVIISGGNTDLSRLEEAKQLKELYLNRKKLVNLIVPNRKGILK